MMELELKELRRRHGLHHGTIAWWAGTEAERVQRMFAAKFVHGDDLYAAGVEALLHSDAPSVRAVLESGDAKRITDWLFANAKQKSSANSHASRRDQIENSHDLYGDVMPFVDDLTSESAEDIVTRLEEHRSLNELLLRIENPRARSALILHDGLGVKLPQVARRLGVSRQAVHQLCARARRDLCLGWSALNTGAFCREYEIQLARVLWRVEDLDPVEAAAARAHLEHCSSCSATIARERRSLASAGAFFPIPILGLLAHAQSFVESVKATFVGVANRANETATGAQSAAATGSGWHNVRPVAAAATIAAVLATGGGVASTQLDDDSAKRPASTASGPIRLFDAIDVPPAPAARRKTRRKRASKPPPATVRRPAAIAPAPTRPPDTSNEFLPDGQ